MTTMILWLWLSTGALWAQGVYTPDHCKAQAYAMVQSGHVVFAQCIMAQES